MVNDKYVVKYLDPRTGKYEYATIKDVGDLQKLNTKVKTSIVDAINSISTDGIDGIDGLRNDLDTIGKTIKSLEDGTLELGDFQSIDDVVSREIEDAINNLKDENSGLLKLTQEEIDKIVSDAESEYRDSIAASVRELETSKSDLEDAREKMTNIGKMLENADINYSSLTQVVDDINLYITDVIEKTDFDMVNGIVSDYKTAVTQSKDGWGVDASKNMLSYLTGRVKNNETSLDVQHGLIQAKVGKDEFQYMTVDNLPAGKENMLHNTSDLRDWNFSSAFIFKSTDDYRFTSIVQSDSAGENIIGTTDELEQGVTYAISAYVNVQNKNKKPNEEKYAPTDGGYTATVIIDGDTIELNNVVEDNSSLDGWKRVSGTFIAKRTAKQDIKFYVTAFNRDTQVGYLSAPKLEKGSSATSWIPHIEDNVSTILSQNAVMRVLSDRITSSVEEVRETKGAFETATSTFDQMADGFELNTNKLSEVLDKYGEVTGVQTQQASELEVLNESITSKVWKQDINTTLDTINIDTSNRIVNSAFNIYSYDEQTGELQLDYWDSNTGFEIKKHSQSLDNYLYAKRSNATSVNPISIKSSPFALRDGEKILFNFEYLAVGNPLDNDNVITLEMYDNDDVRVGLQEFKLSELKKEFLTAYDVGDSYKYNGTYIVKNSSVVKGTITLKLPKNGELWLTKIMLQNAGIGTIGWTPSSIDNQIIQSKLSTEINQLADSIELVAKDERLDAISGLLVKKDGKITISPEAIVSRVTSQELGDKGLVTQTSIKQTEDSLRFDLVDKDGIIQTINASADGLLIDFDKVQIDGELIARMISAQSIDATQGFRLTDNNGNTLLSVVNDNGKPTLSITKDFRVKFGEIGDKLDVTIIGIVEEYYYSVDPNEPIGGRWTSTPNALQGGNNRFIWKRNKIIYQSGKVSYYPSETGINITGSWEYEKESVTAEVVKAIDGAESAKALAVSEANQAMIDANKYADEQDALIKQQVNTSVSNAISSADQAKQVATDSYNNAVKKAEELTVAQSTAFNKKFKENTSAMSTLSKATKDAEAKAQSALTKAGVNANLLTTHKNTLDTIKNTTIPNVNKIAKDAMAEAKSAISSASSAMAEAKKADGKIADYVTKKGLVNGTTVDSKIDTATGEISKKITTVESKIPTEIGGRNLILNSQLVHTSPNNSGLGTATLMNDEPTPYYRVIGDNTISTYSFDGSATSSRFSEPMIDGANYTVSVDVRSPRTGRVGFYSSKGSQSLLKENEWVRIKYTYTYIGTSFRVIGLTYDSSILDYKNWKIEKGNIATDWTPAPEDNYTQEEFKIFESTYDDDVKGINSTLTELSNKKLDGTTYTDFYTNEYKKTAKGVTDTYNKVNKIIDANGNSTDAFAKAVYDRNATRQKASFNEVTKDLVTTATYSEGVKGINQSITTVQGNLDNLSVGGRNLLLHGNGTDISDYLTTFHIEGNRKILSDSDVPSGNFLRINGYTTTGGAPSLYIPGYSSRLSRNLIGKQATLSMYLRGDVPFSFYNQNVGTTWTRVHHTFTFGTSNVHFYIYDEGQNIVDISSIQIEEGNKATDWTPAPEEMQSVAGLDENITAIYNNTSSETAKAINKTLSAFTPKDELDKEVSTLFTNTSSQTAEKINSKLTAIEGKIPTEIGGRNYFAVKNLTPIPATIGSYKVYDIQLKPNTTYTVSAYGTISGNNMLINKVYRLFATLKSTGYQIATDSTGIMKLEFWVGTITEVQQFIDGIAKLKIEEGTVRTDWTPAPEDMQSVAGLDSSITSIYNNTSSETAKAITKTLTAYQTTTGLDSSVSSLLSNTNSQTAKGFNSKLTEIEGKIPTEIGGRNLVLNSSSLKASGLGAKSGSRAEYRTINTGQSYMDLEDGEIITISFDIEMKIATKNPKLQVYNTNVIGHVGISGVTIFDQIRGNVGETINKRVSVTTRAVVRSSPKVSHNTLEFYSNYGSNNFFKISKLKVERGNVATDWSPAPEDMQSVAGLDSSITAIYNNTNSETAKAINSKLTSIEGKIDGLEIGGQNLFAITKTVDGYESRGNITASTENHRIMSNLVDIGDTKSLIYQIWNPNKITTTNSNRVAFFTEANAYISSLAMPTLNGSTYQMFKIDVPTNARKARLGAIMGTGTIDPLIKIKFEKGNKPTDWTPAPEDMATVIKTNEIERTADYSKMAITNLSKNGVVESSSVNATKDGITERVAKVDAKGNISYSNRNVKLNSIVTSVADQKYISQQVQGSNIIQNTIATIAPAGANLFKNSDFRDVVTGARFNGGGNSAYSHNTYPKGWGGYNGGITNPTNNWHAFLNNTSLNFPVVEFNETNGSRNWKAITTRLDNNKYAKINPNANYIFSVDTWAKTTGAKLFGGFYYTKKGGTSQAFHAGQFNIPVTKANKWERLSAKVPLGSDVDLSKPVTFYIYGYGFTTNALLYIKNVSLTEGDITAGWSLSPEDTATQSQVTQLQDSWSMKLKKADDVVTQINATSAGVLIQGKNLVLDGNVTMTSAFSVPNGNIAGLSVDKITGTNAQFTTMITKGLTANVITSNMINANTAMFDKLFSTTSATTRLAARDAWIKSANISTLDASKITSGTIAAARLNANKIVTDGLAANVIKSTHIESSNGLIDKIFANEAYIKRMTGKKAFISSIQAIDISAEKITAGIASKTGNRVTITNTGMKISDSTFETEFINGGPAFFSKSSTGRSLIGEIGNMTSAFNSSKALGIKATYGTPIVLGVQMSKTDTTYKGKLAVHGGGVAVYDTLNVEGDILFTQNGKQALRNIINVDKIFLQGKSYITSTTIVGANGSTMKDTSGWINLQAQWGVNLWYQNQKKARMYGDKFQFWCNIEPQSGFSVSGSSDVRLKHNIVDVKESSLEKLEKIKFKNFTWNSNNKDDFGFIAQEVINIIPEIIEESDDGYYRYNSTRFNMIVAHATKELNDKVKFLENKIERLERIIDGN